MLSLVCLLVLSSGLLADASKVLFLPMMGKSPYFVTKAVADEMAARGHEVLIFLPESSKEELGENQPNLHFYPATDYIQGVANKSIVIDYSTMGVLDKFRFLGKMQVEYCEGLLSSQSTLDMVQDCDVVVGNTPFLCSRIVAEKIGKPSVSLHPGGGFGLFGPFGVSTYLSYVPQFQSRLTRHMSFMQRVKNTLMYALTEVVFTWLMVEPHNELLAKYKITSKTTSELLLSTDLLISQTTFTLDSAQPIPPRLKVVGPILPQPPKKLPDEIAQFMDGASKEGVVVVSFGTVEFGAQTKSMLEAMARAFNRLPLKVIWKQKLREDVELVTSPHVKVLPWIPQNDLLAHPNTRVFVTHVGMNGMVEGVYHGVPMVTCPQFGDQHDNSRRVTENGYGVVIDVYDTDNLEENLLKAVMDVFSDESIRRRVQHASRVVKDRKVTSRAEAADWIEHVINVGDMSHLKPLGDSQPFYKRSLLDVLGFFLLILLLVLYIVYKLLTKLCGRSKSHKQKLQ